MVAIELIKINERIHYYGNQDHRKVRPHPQSIEGQSSTRWMDGYKAGGRLQLVISFLNKTQLLLGNSKIFRQPWQVSFQEIRCGKMDF